MNESFDITGVWVNRLNGKKITVRNTIIGGDNMVILTSDGQQLTMNEFQDYIQMSEDDKGNTPASLDNIKDIESERRVVIGTDNAYTVPNKHPFYDIKGPEQVKEKPKQEHIRTEHKKVSESDRLLNKLFEKIELNVDLDINLKCDNFPVKELQMLIDIYDVSIDEITEYIMNNIVNEKVYKNALSNLIAEKINKV